MAKKPKPPKIPRCLCDSWIHWVLQIASPSKVYAHVVRPTVEGEKYFRARNEYAVKMVECKIENRTCTKFEWHRYRRWRWYNERGPYDTK